MYVTPEISPYNWSIDYLIGFVKHDFFGNWRLPRTSFSGIRRNKKALD
jgi:hypothetical protein